MSRIGKKSISIPDNVKASIVDRMITVTGPKGELSAELSEEILVEISETEISITPKSLEKKARSFWGLSRTIVSNLVAGVFEGIRARECPKGTSIFRLNDHVDRLYNSAKAYNMNIP